jgi:hypothetical protein
MLRSKRGDGAIGAMIAVPLVRVQLSGETAIQVECVEDPSRPGRLLLDVRLHRRDGEGSDRVAQPTAAGFRLPVHQAEQLAEAIVKVASRGAQAALWGAGWQ